MQLVRHGDNLLIGREYAGLGPPWRLDLPGLAIQTCLAYLLELLPVLFSCDSWVVDFVAANNSCCMLSFFLVQVSCSVELATLGCFRSA